MNFFRLYILIIVIVFVNCKKQSGSELKNGDLLFITMECGDLCDAIHAVTSGLDGMDISHLGIVSISNDSIFVIEAAGNSVRKVSLTNFLANTSQDVLHMRVNDSYAEFIPKVIEFCERKIGMPYDDAFLLNNDKYYCSELIYDAFESAYQAPFFELKPMTFKQPNSEDFFDVWVKYYQDLGVSIPEGALGCNPADFSKSNKLQKVGWLQRD